MSDLGLTVLHDGGKSPLVEYASAKVLKHNLYANGNPASLQFTALKEICSGFEQRKMDVFGFETFFIWIFRGHGL
jgi:hypothetical protein